MPAVDLGSGPKPSEPSQLVLKQTLGHGPSSPRMVARAQRVCQSQELTDPNGEQKAPIASTFMNSKGDQRGLTVEYQNQSHFQPVPIHHDESASLYAQRIRGSDTANGQRLQQDGKGQGVRHPQYPRSNESGGQKSNSLVRQKLSLKKVHSRYISQSLGQAVTLKD